MGNLSHGICMSHLIINSHNVQFTHQSHTAQLLSKQGPAGHSKALLALLGTPREVCRAGGQY